MAEAGRGERALAASPLQRSFERAARRRVAVLAYHGVAPEHAEAFEAQLRWLAANRTPLAPQRALEVLEAGHPPPGATLVTFDDGDPTVASVAAPLLARHGIGAIAFVNPAVIGTDAPQWWDEVVDLLAAGGRSARIDAAGVHGPDRVVAWCKRLDDADRRAVIDDLRASATAPAPPRPQLTPDDLRALTDAGVAIGNHGLTHALLDRCDDATLRREVLDAHERLTGWLGDEPTAFAYPNGNGDPRAHAVLAGAGYRAAFAFDHHLSDGPAPDRWAVSRLRVNAWTPPVRFRLIMSGLHPALLATRARLRPG